MGAAEKQANKKSLTIARQRGADTDRSRLVVRNNASNELIIAVVGHVGSGTTRISGLLAEKLGAQTIGIPGSTERKNFAVKPLKASDVIKAWARKHGEPLPDYKKDDLNRAQALQDFGDKMRAEDKAAIARALIKSIHKYRQEQLDAEGDGLKLPDGQPRAYIIDCLRHPAEVQLLRGVYQSAFAVIGVVCDEDRRYLRLFGDGARKIKGKFKDPGQNEGQNFIDRDRKAKEDHGQRVDDTFHLADFFVDNSPDEKLGGKPNKDWGVPEQIERFLRIMTHTRVERPTVAEMGMFAAEGAKLRSACLSRQVGAALVDQAGNLISTGTNEVPRAGGGVYGQVETENSTIQITDERCAFRNDPGCSNTREQRKIEVEVVGALKKFFENKIGTFQIEASKFAGSGEKSSNPLLDFLKTASPTVFNEFLEEHRSELLDNLHKTRLGGLIEFSRAVHAEMDALLSAARKCISPVGARMFVTTFPCHSCARHLVAAGVDEVQYLEPYPKSKALDLHEDAITKDRQNDSFTRPSIALINKSKTPKVLFRPFTGVAPRLYARAFLKDRDLKDDITGDHVIKEPKWGSHWDLGRLSYVQLEAKLIEDLDGGSES